MILIKHIKTGLWLKHYQGAGWIPEIMRERGHVVVAQNYIGVPDFTKAKVFSSLSTAKRVISERRGNVDGFEFHKLVSQTERIL